MSLTAPLSMCGVLCVLFIALLLDSVTSQSCVDAILDHKYACSIDSDSAPINTCGNKGIPLGEDCTPYVGMTVTLFCSHATAILYANGTSLRTNATTYQYATTADSGAYECRGPAGNASRRVIVQGMLQPSVLCNHVVPDHTAQPAVGVGNCTMLVALTPQCCGPAGVVTLPVSFNLYCSNCNVSIAVSWTNHLPVDLDLVVMGTSPVLTISKGENSQTPYRVFPDYPFNPMALITVSGGNSLTAFCFLTTFDDAVALSANVYIPTQLVRSGSSALFVVLLKFTMASGFSYACNATEFLATISTNCSITNFSSAVVRLISSVSQGIELTVNLTNVSDSYNGLVITSSLQFGGAVQWTNTTRLYVISSSQTPSATPLASKCQALCRGLVAGLITPTVVTSLLLLLLILLAKTLTRFKHRPDSFELTAATDVTSTVAGGNKTHPPPVIRSQSQPAVAVKSSGRHQTRVRIYVSYSDDKLEWVTDVLVPILRRMIHTEVVLRDDAMLVGHVVSEERLRLILGADKVLVVCSDQYENSPWCQYELLQSVGRDPRLTEGRVIPVLCEGCRVLPTVIGGVVSLREEDDQFESKLRESVLSSK